MSLKNKFLSYMKSCISMPWLTEVEYLSSAYRVNEGMGSYLDTGWVPNFNSDIDVRFVFAIPQDSAVVRTVLISNYGKQNISIYTSWGIETNTSRKIRLYIDNGVVNLIGSTTLSTKTPYVVHYTYNAGTHVHIINVQSLDKSVNETLTATYKPTNIQESCWMFKDKRSTLGAYHWITIYQMEIKNGLVHQKFLPCLDKHREAGMYETVSGKIYKNLGELPFQYGRRIIEVEWINLTGNQRFNTRFKPNTLSTTVKATFQLTGDDSLSRFPFGCRKAANQADSCTIYIAPTASANPNGYLRLDWPFQASNPRYSLVSTTEKITMEITGNYANVNGEINTSSNVTSYDQTAPFYIGNCYTSSSSGFQSAFVGKFYVVNLLNTYSREDYRYCVPAHDENNVGFFFDRVNHFIMDNEGSNTQDMTWGEEIHPVNYIYGGRPDRYNTRIPFYGYKWESDVMVNSDRTNQALVGSATGACNYWAIMETGSQYGTYALHTSSLALNLTIDPSEARTVFLETGRNVQDTSDYIKMTVEGESRTRTVSEANRTTGYRIVGGPSGNYAGTSYWYGNRCYNKTTDALIQNLVPVAIGNKLCQFLDTETHTLYPSEGNNTTTSIGNYTIGYSQGNELPFGFMPVDYLESTGTQYINTGVIPTNDTGFKITHTICQNNGTDNIVIGCRENSGDSRFWEDIDWGFNDAIGWGFCTYTSVGNRFPIDASMVDSYYEVSCNYMNDRECKVNGTIYDTLDSSRTLPTMTRPIYVFAGNNQGTTMAFYSGKLKELRITEKNKIIANYIPCLRVYDKKPGLFDLNTRQFCTNQGTGEFIFSLNGVRYAALNYLESTGSQYIDTGIYMKSTYGVEIDAKQTDAVQNTGRYLFGDAPATYKRYLIFVTSGNNTYRFGLDNLNRDSNVSAYDNQFHIHKVDNKTYYIDGVSKGNINVDDFTCDRPARLFSVYTSSSLTNNYWQIRSFKAKDENGRIIANYIPALRQTDSKPGMLDLATGTFFVNSGTGEFTYG